MTRSVKDSFVKKPKESLAFLAVRPVTAAEGQMDGLDKFRSAASHIRTYGKSDRNFNPSLFDMAAGHGVNGALDLKASLEVDDSAP